MKPEAKEIILTMAKNDLNATTTAKELHRHRGTVMYWIEKLKKETGLDCRKFYDLVKLVGMVENGDTQDRPDAQDVRKNRRIVPGLFALQEIPLQR